MNSEIDISEKEWVTNLDSEEAVVANIEMELSPGDARKIANALTEAAERAEAAE